MEIKYPSDTQIKSAVAGICEKSIKKPETFFGFLKNMTSVLGIKNIFCGVYDAILISFVLFIGLLIMLVSQLKYIDLSYDNIYMIVFALTPVFFIILYLLTHIKEHTDGAYKLKMTCKYTVNHLLAYRMFVFSILSVLFNTIYIFTLSIKTDINFFAMICISMSALFIFSTVLISVILRFNSILSPIMLSLLWIVMNLLTFFTNGSFYGKLIKNTPIYVWIIICIICIAIYLKKLSILSGKRRINYANS